MTERVREDPSLIPPDGGMAINRPIIVVHKLESGQEGYIIDLSALDQNMDDPRPFGVVLSDLLDQIAAAYSRVTGADQGVLRKHLKKVMRDEDRFKARDPSRYAMSRGATIFPVKN